MITGKAKLAGVIGFPVSHSLSPVIHNYWLSTYKVDGAYVPLTVAPQKFKGAVMGLRDAGFMGANVTVPHKEAAAKLADTLSPTAEKTGAVNTLVFLPDGAIHGDNTDGYGFIQNLKAGCPTYKKHLGRVVILGAGGAARAIAVALAETGAQEMLIVNRTEKNAKKLIKDLALNAEPVAWNHAESALKNATLLVNTTTLGMVGQQPLELSLKALHDNALVTDIVYRPLKTDLLKRAEKRKLKIVDGLGMLLHQARPGFAAWFGKNPTVDAALLKHVLGAMK